MNTNCYNQEHGIISSGHNYYIKATAMEAEMTDFSNVDAAAGSSEPGGTAKPCLVGTAGIVAGTIFALVAERTRIGRGDDNEIILAERTVSRHHATLLRDERGRITLTDENSANGVYLNGVRVQRAMLQVGDDVRIGENHFRLDS
ncbi:MAG: FHA domain-containing protein [Capsulimonadaceae bacterium]